MKKRYFIPLIVILIQSLSTSLASALSYTSGATYTAPLNPLAGLGVDSPTGAFTYSIGIEVPPGRNGIQPRVAFVYNSYSDIGLLGKGWDISTSYIERSTKWGIPKYDSTDTFILVSDGIKELVYIGDSEYRCKIESEFFRIRYLEDNYWEVTDKSGRRYLYGTDEGTRLAGPSGTFRWYLKKVVDTHGNYMDFTYITSSIYYLERIDYTGGNNIAPTFRVEFWYSSIPEEGRRVSYRSGARQKVNGRLNSVLVKQADSLIRRYELDYTSDNESNVSLLSSITLYGSDWHSPLWTYSFGYTTLEGAMWEESDRVIPDGDFIINNNDDGRRLVNITGSPTPELMIAKDGYKKVYNLNSGSIYAENYNLPSGNFITNGVDQGIRFADLDGNGLVDISIARNGYKNTYLRSGNSWIDQNASWDIPDGEFVVDGVDQGRRLADLNGDGLSDLLIAKDGYKAVYINKKGSWEQHNEWNIPDGDFVINGEDQGRRLADLNGDGLVDLIIAKDGYRDSYLDTGQGWVLEDNYDLPVGDFITNGKDGGVRLVDMNNDELVDVVYAQEGMPVEVYINTGNGYREAPEFESFPEGIFFINTENEDQGVILEDIDTNGYPDILKAKDGDKKTFVFSAGPTNLLNKVILPFMGEIEIKYGYEVAKVQDIAGGIAYPKPLFVVDWLIINRKELMRWPITGEIIFVIPMESYHYSYLNGYYNSQAREFTGFSRVYKYDYPMISGQTGSTVTDFLVNDIIYKGKVTRELIRLYEGNGFWESVYETSFSWFRKEIFPGVNFVYLNSLREEEIHHYKDHRTSTEEFKEYEYDNYGNITRYFYHGFKITENYSSRTIVTRPDYQKYEVITEYSYNTDNWILDKPAHTYLNDVTNGVKVTEDWFYYDGNESYLGMPILGDLTREEHWLNNANNPVTNYTYDEYGNRTSITDPLGNRTDIEYDSLKIYPIRETNPLGHQTNIRYNPAIGKPISTTDSNGQTVSYKYDIFGRLVKIYGPLDTAGSPTVEYIYNLIDFPPRVTTITREKKPDGTEQVHETIDFFDGLGRHIQTKKRNNNTYIVTYAVGYNNRSLIYKKYLPVEDGQSSDYWVPESPFGDILYRYDVLDREIEIENPDNTTVKKIYNPNNIVEIIDEEGNSIVSRYDFLDRMREIKEYNNGEEYVTRYTYNGLSEIVQVIDNLTNTTTVTYDTLGRKIAMDDPDMGSWSYSYDANSNLISQTNAKDDTITYEYDALNRIILKNYPDGRRVEYRYDEDFSTFPIGRLTSIADSAGAARYYYDEYGNVPRTEKQIDGITYTFQNAYNNLGWLTAAAYPDGEVVNYTYNPMGIEAVTGNSNYVTNIDYNPLGEITQINCGNGTVMNYTYDVETKRLNNITGPQMNLDYFYDDAGNILQINNNIKGTQQAFIYDDLYRLVEASGPYGVLTYNYNSIGNMTYNSEVGNYIYGQNNAGPHAVTTAGNRQYTYDASGNMLSNGRFTFQYDYDDRVSRANLTDTTEQKNVTLNQGWNFFTLPLDLPNNNIPDIFSGIDYGQIDKFNSGQQRYDHNVDIPEYNQFNSLDYGLGYLVYNPGDSSEILNLSGTLSAVSTQIQLRTGWNLIGTAYTEVQSIGYVFSSLVFGQDYDVIAKYDQSSQSYKYYRNNPASDALSTIEPNGIYFIHCLRDATLTLPPATEISDTIFIYDYEGNRIKKTDSSGTTIYIGDLYQINPDGSTTKYIYAGDQRVAEVHTQGNEVHTYYYHSDHLGSSTVITDENGSVAQELEYKPYGQLIANLRNSGHDVSNKFTDQELDDSTGLYYYGARYYDPVLCRFTQADTLVPDPSDPQALNRYSYTRNNPVRYTDPSGNLFLEFAGNPPYTNWGGNRYSANLRQVSINGASIWKWVYDLPNRQQWSSYNPNPPRTPVRTTTIQNAVNSAFQLGQVQQVTIATPAPVVAPTPPQQQPKVDTRTDTQSAVEEPQVLYHYTSQESAMTILATGLYPGSFRLTDVGTYTGAQAQQLLAIPPHDIFDNPPNAVLAFNVRPDQVIGPIQEVEKRYPHPAIPGAFVTRTGKGLAWMNKVILWARWWRPIRMY